MGLALAHDCRHVRVFLMSSCQVFCLQFSTASPLLCSLFHHKDEKLEVYVTTHLYQQCSSLDFTKQWDFMGLLGCPVFLQLPDSKKAHRKTESQKEPFLTFVCQHHQRFCKHLNPHIKSFPVCMSKVVSIFLTTPSLRQPHTAFHYCPQSAILSYIHISL